MFRQIGQRGFSGGLLFDQAHRLRAANLFMNFLVCDVLDGQRPPDMPGVDAHPVAARVRGLMAVSRRIAVCDLANQAMSTDGIAFKFQLAIAVRAQSEWPFQATITDVGGVVLKPPERCATRGISAGR